MPTAETFTGTSNQTTVLLTRSPAVRNWHYGSRKFLLALGTMFVALGMVLTGSLSPQEGADMVLKAAAAYLLAEGAGDALGRLKGLGT